MPEATSFKALGAGDGFSFCPTKVDVSGRDYWTTFSGWSKVSAPVDEAAEAESIAESRRLAMKLFWNGHALNCDATTDGLVNDSSISRVQIDYRVQDFDVPYPDPPILIDSGEATPMLRTCIPSFFEDISKNFEDEVSPGHSFAQFGVSSISAMYDGATTDIDNFIGYGLGNVDTSGNPGATLEAKAGAGQGIFSGVFAASFGYTPSHTTNLAFDAGYVTFEGMELFAYVAAQDPVSNPDVTGSVNLSALSAQCTRQSYYPPSTSTTTVSLSSIDFYTYPE